jgi:hypothetical protein
MKPIRFETDVKLWAWITLILLGASWCIPVLSVKGGPSFSNATALKEFVLAVYQRDGDYAQLCGGMFVVYAIYSVFLATVIGWVLHCVVVIVRTTLRQRRADAS